MCALSPTSSTRPLRYCSAWRAESVKELIQRARPWWIDSPVSFSQVSASSSNVGVGPSGGGAMSSWMVMRSTPSSSRAAMTMPLVTRSPMYRGRTSAPMMSARYMPRVGAVPGKSMPARRRMRLLPPSQPTRYRLRCWNRPSGPSTVTVTPSSSSV